MSVWFAQGTCVLDMHNWATTSAQGESWGHFYLFAVHVTRLLSIVKSLFAMNFAVPWSLFIMVRAQIFGLTL